MISVVNKKPMDDYRDEQERHTIFYNTGVVDAQFGAFNKALYSCNKHYRAGLEDEITRITASALAKS